MIGTHVQEVVSGVLNSLLDHEQTLAALTGLIVEEPATAHHWSNLTFAMERPTRLLQLARIVGRDGPKVQFRYEHCRGLCTFRTAAATPRHEVRVCRWP